jgi:NADPH2:quinone reductase
MAAKRGIEMRAIELAGLDGPRSVRVVDVATPVPGAAQALIRVTAAGVNFADVEMSHGRYPTSAPLPCVIGFEVAGIVVDVGSAVTSLRVGDRVAATMRGGGFAEFATVDAENAIQIPDGVSFAEATAALVQGITAHALLVYAARLRPDETVLVQAAAGGVGLILVQLARLLGVERVVALAGAPEKLKLLESLGAVAINYREPGWTERVLEATHGRGADVVFESVAGVVGEESARLVAPLGRTVLFGAKNALESISAERMRRIIYEGQSLVGFHVRTLRPDQIAESVSTVLGHASAGRLRLVAETSFPLERAAEALEAIESRRTVGKVVLAP